MDGKSPLGLSDYTHSTSNKVADEQVRKRRGEKGTVKEVMLLKSWTRVPRLNRSQENGGLPTFTWTQSIRASAAPRAKVPKALLCRLFRRRPHAPHVTLRILKELNEARFALGVFLANGFPSCFFDFLKMRKTKTPN